MYAYFHKQEKLFFLKTLLYLKRKLMVSDSILTHNFSEFGEMNAGAGSAPTQPANEQHTHNPSEKRGKL